jgi:hypothetical protein
MMQKIRKYAFAKVSYEENFQLIYKTAYDFAAANKSKVIVIVPIDTKNLKEIATYLDSKPIGQHSFLFTGDFRILALHFRKVNKFGEFGQESFFDFVTWLQEKSRSDGHEWAVMAKPKDTKTNPIKDESESVPEPFEERMVTNYDPEEAAASHQGGVIPAKDAVFVTNRGFEHVESKSESEDGEVKVEEKVKTKKSKYKSKRRQQQSDCDESEDDS